MEAAEENYDDITNLAFKELTLEIMEDAVADFCNSVHRALSYGYFPLEETVVIGQVFEVYSEDKYNEECATHLPGSDIYGNFKGGAECTNLCPVCQVRVCSTRFAPHLSNCMGFGRPRRNTIKRTTIDIEDSDYEDVDEGDNYNSKKEEKGKATRRRGRGRGNDTPQVSEANLANMSPEKLKEYLSQVFQNCGVIGRSGRFCRNSLKCSMHDDHHRREVRDSLLGKFGDKSTDDSHIDVDTVDEESPTLTWFNQQKAKMSSKSSAASSSSRQEPQPGPSKYAGSSFSYR